VIGMEALLAQWGWLGLPLLALVAACLALVPLGRQVLERGVVFIDLAVAQVAACGALLCAVWIDHPGALEAGMAAGAAALLGALLVWSLARAWPAQREALIGLVYVAAASLAVVAAAWDPHGRERLSALLAADVLWAAPMPVLWLGGLGVLVMAAVLFRPALFARDAVFYPVFALALSAAVPVLGLYLVFAFLIAPALWIRRGSSVLIASAWAFGASVFGLGLSWQLDWPSGACVAISLGMAGLASAFSRREERRAGPDAERAHARIPRSS